MRRVFRWIIFIFGGFLALLLILLLYVRLSVNIPEPDLSDSKWLDAKVDTSKNINTLGNAWLKQNEHGLWEMYVQGNGADRGIIAGKLSESLIKYQEEVFVAEIKKYIPSDAYLGFLRIMVGYFNRNLDEHIPQEYLDEIYGISLAASSEFNAYGDPFLRILNYHAAHDIGHALQNYALVGCTSFAVWDEYSADSSIYAGRNFDFYFGDAFAEEKIVEFVRPEEGTPFAFITWGGMIGTVSGMNLEGLSVTINASKSDIPKSAAAPVSLVAREILQYSKTIDEALKIAEKREMFVAESFMVSSTNDKRAIIIEKTPAQLDTFSVQTGKLICANHFQGDKFLNDETNTLNIQENATGYRFKRMQQLLIEPRGFNEDSIAEILRDVRGLDDKKIGIGNEKAVNQMISHHSVIFDPSEKIMWVSTPPDVFHEYIAYDLNKIFDSLYATPVKQIYDSSLTIPADKFIRSQAYNNYYTFKSLLEIIQKKEKYAQPISKDSIDLLINSNPDFYVTYEAIADYFYAMHKYEEAIRYYEKALDKEINAKAVEQNIEAKLLICRKKIT